MIKYGIKLWTINKNWFKEAIDLFKKGEIDFVELYLVPDSFTIKEIMPLKELRSLITLHAPYFFHGFNLLRLNPTNIVLFKNQVLKTADFLKAKHIIVHAGWNGSEEDFKKNAAKIKSRRILIENMPKLGIIDNTVGFGYALSQLKFIKACGFNICFDFSHAIKSAFSENLDYKKYILSLLKATEPFYFHLCGGRSNIETDEHLNLWEGDFDIKWAKKLLLDLAEKRDKAKKDTFLVFEVPKQAQQGKYLANDLKNINYFKSLLSFTK